MTGEEEVKWVQIKEAEYERLYEDSMVLSYLRAAGVDNWDFYDDALEQAFGELND